MRMMLTRQMLKWELSSREIYLFLPKEISFTWYSSLRLIVDMNLFFVLVKSNR